MITIPISGKQGSGKSTTAELIASRCGELGLTWSRGRFAAPLYEMHDAVLQIAKKYNIDRSHLKKDGPLLQLLGTEWGRNTIHENVWVQALEYTRLLACKENSVDIFIVEDLRFKNEFHGFTGDLGPVLKVRLECPREIRMQRVEMWRPNDTHPSETDLDEYVVQGKFDLVFHTDQESTEVVVNEIMRRIADARTLELPGLGPEQTI